MIYLIDFLAAGVVDSSGNPLSGGSVTFYDAGTTTLVSAYQDRELEVEHQNPATLDSAGKLVAFADQRVKLVLKDSSGTTVATIDNLGIGDGDIQTSDIADGAVQSSNIADGAVTAAKLASGAVTSSKIQASAITTAKLADGGVTKAKLASLGQQLSISSGAFSTTSASAVVVTNSGNVEVPITTTGRPVFLCLVPDGSVNAASIYTHTAGNGHVSVYYAGTQADGTTVSSTLVDDASFGGSSTSAFVYLPPGTFTTVHDVVAGTYTYTLKAQSDGTNATQVNYCKLLAFELA